MQDILIQGVAFLRAHQAWAGLLLGLGAFIEALVVIGVFAPLTPFLVAVGAGIASGVFSPTILVWTMAGCGLGNWASYEAGLRARRRDENPRWIPQSAKVAAEALFERYGAFAVILGRFLGPTASIVPFVAGYAAMPRRRFVLANLASSLVWPVAMAALGYIGARSLGVGIHLHG